jgi:N-acetylmuramoyl-L-alanine amidase
MTLKMLKITKTCILLSLSGCLLTGGCHPADGEVLDRGHEYLPAPPGAISVYQLAGGSGLSVSENSRTIATLSNSSNVVVIYSDPGGGIYVNGSPLRAAGPVTPVGDMLFVAHESIERVRRSLRVPVEPVPLTSIAPGPSQVRPIGRAIVIDPGHGGKDPGAISYYTGIREKDVVLDAATQVAEELRRHDRNVVMTRSADEFVELNDRANLANRSRASMFISIHADSCPRSSMRGFTIYVAKSASKEAAALGEAIARRMSAVADRTHGVRRADYRVLVRTICPAVLVELGYLSNRHEGGKLSRGDYRRSLGEAISQGVLDYQQGLDR